MNRLFATLAPCLLAAVLLAACATIGTQADIERLEQRLEANPNDAGALRDLGVLYMRTRRFEQARPYLARAYAQDSSDAETMFYHGLVLETAGNRSEALRIYGRYRQIPRLSPNRRRMAGRYKVLVREVVREEIQARLAREADFQAAPPNTVAVFPLVYQGDDERYAPLGRGLSEMLAIDLSQVQALRVLERVRLDVLLEELDLAQQEAFDASTAPRVGRILAAGRLIGGSYTVLDGDQLRVDAASVEIDEDPSQSQTTKSDALANLFVLEKDLVFALIDELGIELTPAERERIERVPTRNLQAFLAYSRGLQDEDAGRLGAAQAQFELARTIDPSLDLATEQAGDLSEVDQMSGDPEDVAGGGPSPTDELVGQRQESLTNSTGTLYIPDQDTRNTPEAEVQELPWPRPPPPRGN